MAQAAAQLRSVRAQVIDLKKTSRQKLKTLFAVGELIVFGVIASFVSVFILNIAGVPGALIAGTARKRSKPQFVFGSIVSALGQSYVYLAFTAFTVNWTGLAVSEQGFVVWPVAFCAVMIPMWRTLIRARVEAREQEDANPQVEALHLTIVITLVTFFVFTFAPSLMKSAWGWVPYMN